MSTTASFLHLKVDWKAMSPSQELMRILVDGLPASRSAQCQMRAARLSGYVRTIPKSDSHALGESTAVFEWGPGITLVFKSSPEEMSVKRMRWSIVVDKRRFPFKCNS